MKERRKYTRQRPDSSTIVSIDTSPTHVCKDFSVTHYGLVYEEAMKGCGCIVLATDELHVDDRVLVKMGEMPVFRAEVRWRMPVDNSTLRVGFLFVE